MNGKTVFAALAAALFIGASAAKAGPVFDSVKQRGSFKCGINQPNPGWEYIDKDGVWQGFDVDICRAIAAAVFGDPKKVEFVSVSGQTRFPALQTGEIDLLNNGTTETLDRDGKLGFNFGPIVFYDGQGFMVRKDLGVSKAKDLNGATICVLPGTTTELNLSEYFRANSMTFKPVVIENLDELTKAFFGGRCDAITNDRSSLAGLPSLTDRPDDYVILPDVISKEPLAPLVKHGDDQWFDVIKWTVYALMAAEEAGITKDNVAQVARETKAPDIQRLLGVTPGLGASIGLDDKFVVNEISAVGNYGEIYERHLGTTTPLKLSRGVNALWTHGGLVYAPPLR